MADITRMRISDRTLPAGRTKWRLIFTLTYAVSSTALRAHSESLTTGGLFS